MLGCVWLFHNLIFSCRHAYIAGYFDETLAPCKGNCDFCKNPQKVKDGLKCLELVQKVGKRKREAAEDAAAAPLYGGGRGG